MTNTKHIAALEDLRLGVELDRHNLPDGDAKLAALDQALTVLRAADEPVLRIYAEGSMRTVTEWLDGAVDLPDGDYNLYAAPQASTHIGRLLDAAHAAVEILDSLTDDAEAQLASVELSNAAASIGAPQASAEGVRQDWKLVPVEPTESMVVAGFESTPDAHFSPREEWVRYEAMTGCQQAAHRARLCWAAMLAAAPAAEASEGPDYEALEREHFGDADKGTGIYAPAAEDEIGVSHG